MFGYTESCVCGAQMVLTLPRPEEMEDAIASWRLEHTACEAVRVCAGCGEPLSGPARVLGGVVLHTACPVPTQAAS
jgi:hypothetical protein